MEHILNKIDENLRNQVKEITKDGKVHAVKDNKITTDNENERNYKNNSKIFKESYVVQAEKQEKYEVNAFGTEDENKTLGKFLDIKE